jgi:cullin 1
MHLLTLIKVAVFEHIADKDIFQRFYAQMLAKRLLKSNFASRDVEMRIISSLRGTCDAKFTNALQHMIQDLQISKELQSTYSLWQTGSQGIGAIQSTDDDSYKILYSGFWPLSAPVTPFTPPKEILERCNLFEDFYAQKYEGRKLTWLWSISKVELKINYAKWNGRIPYIFQLSAFQSAILLLFNDKENLSHAGILDSTELDKTILDPCLDSLLKAKVLLAHPCDGNPEQGLEYTLNYNFKSRKHKVPLNIRIKSETNKEVERVYRAQGEDRRLVIQVSLIIQLTSRYRQPAASNFSSALHGIHHLLNIG